MSKIPQCSSLQPKHKITLASLLFFRAHPSKSCGISGQDTSFLFCLCIYLPINASWCLDSQCIAYIKQRNQPNIWYVHNQVIYIEIPVPTLASFGIPMGYVPPLSLAGCSLNESLSIHHHGGGKIKVMYIINVYIYSLYHSYHTPLMMMYAVCLWNSHNRIIYIFTWSSLSLHPPKDDVCDHQRSKWYGMYITAWHICQQSISSSHPSSLVLMCTMCLYI